MPLDQLFYGAGSIAFSMTLKDRRRKFSDFILTWYNDFLAKAVAGR